MQSVAIVLFCISSAILYGVIHDQITARICLEYFTIGHPPIGTDDPTMLGLAWGVIATWWVGLLLGIPFAIVARVGSRPKRDVRSLVRPIVGLLTVMAIGALGAGLLGWILAEYKIVYLVDGLADAVPAEKHKPYLADLWAHSASYLVGLVGGIVVMVRVWRSRSRMAGDSQ